MHKGNNNNKKPKNFYKRAEDSGAYNSIIMEETKEDETILRTLKCQISLLGRTYTHQCKKSSSVSLQILFDKFESMIVSLAIEIKF